MIPFLFALSAWAAPTDEAIDALVRGEDREALRVLRGAVAADPDGRIRCLLAEVALHAGRPDEALQVVAALQPDAACAGRGAFVAAEAVRAQGQLEEAAVRYGALTDRLFEPEVQPLASRLEMWADRIVEEEGNTEWAAAVLLPAARLEKDLVRRRMLARRIASLQPAPGPPRQFAVAELSKAVQIDDLPSDRRLLAPLLDFPWSMALLEPLPDDAETMAVRIAVAPDRSARHQLVERLIRDHPASPQAQTARLELGLELAEAGWVVEARVLLQPLGDERAVHALAMLAVQTGAPDARALLEDFLERFPTSRFRSEAEAQLMDLQLDALRRAETFDGAAWDALATTPAVAFEAAWASPTPASRLDELIARWPGSSEASQALQHRASEEGLEWLQSHVSPSAANVRNALSRPEIGIRASGSGQPEVELMVQGAEELEIRLHRIDLDGWLEAGGRPGSLGSLDVAIIAPDRVWTATVPGEGLQRTFTLPIDVPGPGLYSVTAGTPERSARTLLLVSSTTVLARSQGPDLAMTALHDGRPVANARFLVRSGTSITEVSADREGLARTEIATGGDAVVVALTRHGPALLEVGAAYAQETQPIRTAVELDRPVYRPGDVVRFRALATRAGKPMAGQWRVSLEAQGVVHERLRIQADRSGAITGEVVIPWTSAGRLQGGSSETRYQLTALPPEHDSPVPLASVVVVDSVRLGHDVRFIETADTVAVAVVDGSDVPVAGQALHVGETLVRTDATGRLDLAGPPSGIPWAVDVRIPGETERYRYTRPAPRSAPRGMKLADPRAAPEEPIQIELMGEGRARIRVSRLDGPAPRPAPRGAPEPFSVPELQVYSEQSRKAPGTELRTTVREQEVDLGDGSAQLPGLSEGWYQLDLVDPAGRASAIGARLEVRAGTRVRLDREPTVGRAMPVRVDGGWALLTAEAGRMVDARLVPPGGRPALAVDRRWHGEVSLVGTTATDQHIRAVEVDASLQVSLAGTIEDGRWKISGVVSDAAGTPVRAEVVVRAVDSELIAERGAAQGLPLSLLSSSLSWTGESASSSGLTHGGWAVAIAAELMAESAREADARRRALAAEGRLDESRLGTVLRDGVPLVQNSGVLGVRGSGYGAGGLGSGSAGGRMGTAGMGSRGSVQGRQGIALRGQRELGLWRVVETDRDGRWTVDAAAPDGQTVWQLDATAVGAESLGMAGIQVRPPVEPWLAIDAPGLGEPGDVADVRIRVVNPGEATTVALLVDGVPATLQVDAGGTVTHRVELEAGETLDVGLGAQRQTVSFPIRSPLEHVGTDLPVSLGLAPDPAGLFDVGRAAVAGRSALAVLPLLEGEARRSALIEIRAAVGAVRCCWNHGDARAQAQALLLLAEATPVLENPRIDLERLVDAVGIEPNTPLERLELAWARAVAGRTPAEATLGRLIRDRDRLDAEGQALLVRLMGRLEREVDWTIEGQGPQAVLARGRGRRGPLGTPSTGIPPLGHPDRADWLRAARPMLRTSTRVAALPAVPPDTEIVAARRPAGLGGRGLRIAGAALEDGSVYCGSAAAPCRLALGDGLSVSPLDPRWIPGAGLTWSVDRRSLVAQTEGRFTLSGLGRPLHVEIGEGASPLDEASLLAVAKLQLEIGESAAPWIASRPSLEDWAPSLRATAAEVRFAQADPEDGRAWVAAFEDLRDQVPHARIALGDVLTTARAYQATGRPERAIDVYERVIGQLFLREAALASEIEPYVGVLASIEAVRQIRARYPSVPLVQAAEFALPDRLLSMVGDIPALARARGVTDTELRLTAAAWDREFVALSPDSPLAPEAGLRLASGLLEMGARERTLEWAVRLQERHPGHPLLDRWLLLEALMRTELGGASRARSVLQRLSSDELPLEGGRLGPSPLREDARLALGRLAESDGRYAVAADWYRQVASTFPEASLASTALERVSLTTAEPVVSSPTGERSAVTIQAANLAELSVRAYAVDLRTLFLRESGLPRPEEVQIDGLRPDYTTTVAVRAAPFRQAHRIDLPLTGPGAWLVRLDGGGQSETVWVIRSNLQLDSVDANGLRRLVARMSGVPVADVPIRAVGSDGIVAEATDIRGVVVVGAGSPAMAQRGPHYALTADARPAALVPSSRGAGARMPSTPTLLDRVQSREEERRRKSRSRYDFIGDEAPASIEASFL